MFCGILPWTWFSSSILESSNVLIAGGNLIKKVLFPAEVLPIVTVLANMVHFFLGLPILVGFLIYYQRPLDPLELLWFPVIVSVQLLVLLGLGLLVSALTVHFRDLKDILGNLLTLWFFATPIIYPMKQAPEKYRWLLNLNPMTHLAISYQEVLFYIGPHGHWQWLVALLVGAFVTSSSRLLSCSIDCGIQLCGGSVTGDDAAIDVTSTSRRSTAATRGRSSSRR